ncbi:MAG: 4-hydroxythreonine-4-phosphate dehydrogenase PdxA [Proteobacteria bacterium]|nr:4-hydroxythreonine-4-phosphate dehydrogenase PdxA [Pseudomonadota bacterium]
MNDRPFLPRLAVTLGEPAGIGPELVAALAATGIAADLIAIGDKDLLLLAAQARGIALTLEADDGQWRRERAPGTLRYAHIPAPAPVVSGKLDVRNAPHVIAVLARAADGCLEGEFDALVTAPVQKSIVNDAGIAFSGHTEFFADRAKCDVAMLLVAPGLRVALATTHLPLSEVPAAITPATLVRVLRIVHNDLRHRFGIDHPRIAVLGLNPHAGERGHLGREEVDVIAPTLAALRADGMHLEGPLSADTAFVPAQRARFDAYLAMYHDQGLPVLKALGFGDAVNVTLGLPFVRTSVDHGTALDLAGTGRANPASLIAATKLATELARA